MCGFKISKYNNTDNPAEVFHIFRCNCMSARVLDGLKSWAKHGSQGEALRQGQHEPREEVSSLIGFSGEC
jgi:hypothetical protein